MSDAAKARLAAQQAEAVTLEVDAALRVAEEAPGVLRAQRKAAALLQLHPEGRKVEALTGLLTRLERSNEPCVTGVEAGELRLTLGDRAGAVAPLLDAATRCRSVRALGVASRALRSLDRCSELLPPASAMWSQVEGSAQVKVLDAVAGCAPRTTWVTAMNFAPEAVVRRYIAEVEASEQRARCRSACAAARSHCVNSCGGGLYCGEACASREASCTAVCQ